MRISPRRPSSTASSRTRRSATLCSPAPGFSIASCDAAGWRAPISVRRCSRIACSQTRTPTPASTSASADANKARFTRCDLSFARFERSDGYDLCMEDCNLRGIRFTRVSFTKSFERRVVRTSAAFRRCNFHLAEMTDLGLGGCDLSGSLFREADLSASDLEGADLRNSDLFGAILTERQDGRRRFAGRRDQWPRPRGPRQPGRG